MIDELERNNIISIFADAQEIVEQAFGVTGSSLVRDQLTIYLASNLLGRYWHEKYKPECQSSKLSQEDFISQVIKETPKPDPEHDKAIDLLMEARRLLVEERQKSGEPASESSSLAWIWLAYQFFLKQLREAESKESGEKEAP